MPPHRVVAGLAALLSAESPVLPAGRVSAARPALAAELPGLAVGMELADGATVSPGRFHREGDPGRLPLRWERMQGALLLELWTASASDAATLAQRLEDRLASPTLPRAHGFLRLTPQRVEAAESLQQTTGVGGSFAAWRQRLQYAFAHEALDGNEPSDGAPIHRIDVTIDDATPDQLTIGH